jgi:ABC-type transport system substrate-binding protein
MKTFGKVMAFGFAAAMLTGVAFAQAPTPASPAPSAAAPSGSAGRSAISPFPEASWPTGLDPSLYPFRGRGLVGRCLLTAGAIPRDELRSLGRRPI